MVRTTSVCFAALALLLAPSASAQDLCATVMCIANGDVECNRATDACPPCLYALSSGYSCYDKASGKCPFEDVLLTCSSNAAPAAAVTPATTPASSSTVKPTRAPTTAPVTEPPATEAPDQIDTPSTTTYMSSVTPRPATTTSTPGPASDDAGQAAGPNSIQDNNPSSSFSYSFDFATTSTTSTTSSESARTIPSAGTKCRRKFR